MRNGVASIKPSYIYFFDGLYPEQVELTQFNHAGGSSANNLVRAVRFKYNMLRVLPSKDFAKLYKLEHLWQGFSVQTPPGTKFEITDEQEQETSFYMNSGKNSNTTIKTDLTYKKYMEERFGGEQGILLLDKNAGDRQLLGVSEGDKIRVKIDDNRK